MEQVAPVMAEEVGRAATLWPVISPTVPSSTPAHGAVEEEAHRLATRTEEEEEDTSSWKYLAASLSMDRCP